jgi:hypothetical protein
MAYPAIEYDQISTMWQPPERIKHERPAAASPGRADVAGALLFHPIAIGPRTAATRTWIPAMVPWRATEDGFVTPDVIDWYRRFAEGRPGVLVVEATGIRDIPSGPLLRIGHDRFGGGLARLVEAVREALVEDLEARTVVLLEYTGETLRGQTPPLVLTANWTVPSAD